MNKLFQNSYKPDGMKKYEYKVRSKSKWIDIGFSQMPNVLSIDSDLSVGAKAVLQCLYVHKMAHKFASPSNKTLCAELGMSVSQLNRYKKELYAYGIITLKTVFNQKTNTEINIYEFNDTDSFMNKIAEKVKKRLGYESVDNEE